MRSAKAANRKILVILGDGIDPVLELHGLTPIKEYDISHPRHGRLRARDQSSWSRIEHVRLMTQNVEPFRSYQFIFHLVRLQLVQAIITTNYDLTLDSLFSRLAPHMNVKINPILNPREYNHQGYCSPQDPGALPIWKIHGSLSHVLFRKCKTLFPCPDFVIPFDPMDILDEFDHLISHVYLPRHASCCSARRSLSRRESRCEYYVHVMDWKIPNFSRHPIFQRIIRGSMAEFHKDPYAILILGFKGNKTSPGDPRHEEINDEAENVSGRGIQWAMFVSPRQYDRIESDIAVADGPHSHLWKVAQDEGGFCFHGEISDIGDILMGSLVDAGLMTGGEIGDFVRDHLSKEFASEGYCERMR